MRPPKLRYTPQILKWAMSTIYTARFDKLTVRFVSNAGRILCVSKADMVELAASVADPDSRAIFRQLFEKGIRDVLDQGDVRSGILGDAAIGPVLHHVSAGSLIHLWANMPANSPQPLLEYSRRMNTVLDWYIANIEVASKALGLTWEDNMNAAIERMDRANPPLTVTVTHADGHYTAECDALHLVAEAPSLDELTETAWSLVPDLIELNALPYNAEHLRLRFDLVQQAPHRLAL